MKAFVIDRYKGDLVQRDLADPVAGPGVLAAATKRAYSAARFLAIGKRHDGVFCWAL